MTAQMMKDFDESSFKRWLQFDSDTDAIDTNKTLLLARNLLEKVDISGAKTDEQVYVALFSSKFFRKQDLMAQAQFKRTAILIHCFLKGRVT